MTVLATTTLNPRGLTNGWGVLATGRMKGPSLVAARSREEVVNAQLEIINVVPSVQAVLIQDDGRLKAARLQLQRSSGYYGRAPHRGA